jgi:formate hydrogenlyase transcriptional activator
MGRFERANGGTLFLDEIGDLPLELQPKLLRVVQDGQFERLGSATTLQTDVRVICATHGNLTEMVDERLFRADLFYRLSVFPIEVPPLRDRREDIRLLVHHFAMHYAARLRKRITAISEEFMAALARHSWPGNVRELQNFVERSVILTEGNTLRLPAGGLKRTIEIESEEHTTLEQVERHHIRKTLEQVNWVVGGPRGAAHRLGLKRSTLYARMQKLGIFTAKQFAENAVVGAQH